MPMISSTPDGVVIEIRVIPRASRSGLSGVRDGTLRLRLHAPPVDGAANEEVVEILSKALGVPRRAVTIVSGARSRLKRVRIEGVTAAFVHSTFEAQDSVSDIVSRRSKVAPQ